MAAAAAAVLVCAAGREPAAALAQAPAASTRPSQGDEWISAPAYAELFAPAIHRSAYQFFTTSRSIGEVLPQLVRDPASVQTPGGWTARSLLPFDAFGQSGGYDRTRLARLYGARRAQVARGPRQAGGVVIESWTLISPYPDTALSRLDPGTLLVVLRLP